MTPERWKKIDDLLDRALEHEPSQRRAFLEDACDKDSELRLEVESLLIAHERAGNVLRSSPLRDETEKPVDSLQSLLGRHAQGLWLPLSGAWPYQRWQSGCGARSAKLPILASLPMVSGSYILSLTWRAAT